MSTALLTAYLMGLSKAAEALGVSIYTVRRLVDAGALKSVNVGSRILISSVEVERALREGVGDRRKREAK